MGMQRNESHHHKIEQNHMKRAMTNQINLSDTDKARSFNRDCKTEWQNEQNKKSKGAISKNIAKKRKIDKQMAEY
jgi:hypothetical protein